ncbi:hypothetical protein CMV30_11920 [Nibricoccus aquaticus]|uniref:TonB-dependent receptor plug domain-containing protein n=1 Tax=Nibricoccus aquaticus TaxID=2576891 RepID=A0A290Q7C8_9BACT|nr:TonB-dependent receptor plug domain-containing protein [Nibricoccus aquaticus]ATC64605.1 hypothetical protein CMV30_11920 [Nibricoccus aquaticus]
MKTNPRTPAAVGQYLTIGLAALLTVTTTRAQTTPPAIPTPATPVTQPDDEVLVLSPFEVKTERDYGYLKTNSATATRIGTEIQKVPVNISVMSRDFLDDTGVSSITDILRYTASGSPDSRFAMRLPGNSATPQGNFTMRGFTVNSLLRNGVFRYASYNLDNVDRVEIVKGPAAVFFGQGYPGGVINYITKKPQFEKNFTTLSYTVDDNGGDKVILDHNAALSSQAALRVVGAWTDQSGDRNYEFKKNLNITPSLTLNPFKSGKLRINLELEYLKESYNQNDYSWVYPTAWFEAYANPTPELIAASGVANATAYRARIFNSPTNWIADVRKARNDPSLPLYTTNSPNGYYTNTSGVRVKDEAFNFTNSGAYTENEVKTFQTTVDLSPFSWVDARYVFTNDNSQFDNIGGLNIPNADGITFNAINAGAGNGYYRRAQDHQIDLIFKADAFGIKNKILVGGIVNKQRQQYMASAGAVYYKVPGYNYPTPPVNNLPNPAGVNGLVPTNQVLRDRFGNILTAQQVYSQWDPSIHPNPPADKVYNIERNILDGYNTKNEAVYVNWQVQLLQDKLTILSGYRKESTEAQGQTAETNAPWFIPPATAYLDQTTYPANVYNYTPSYAGDPEMFRTRKGDAWMGGASYEIKPGLSVYATISKTFKINTGLAGGYDELALDQLLQDALTFTGGSFNYRGSTITSVPQGRSVLIANGSDASIENEEGLNYEVGVKTSLWNDKLVSTVSLFRGIRKDQKLDDTQKISSDPFNSSTTLFAPTSLFYNKRNFRWRTVGVENQIEGTEFDIIWTPIRNYQAVINGAWMWQAETMEDPTKFKPGTAGFNSATASNQALWSMFFGNRIENVPEYRFNVYNKYTFTHGPVRGLALSLGARYSSETVQSRSFDWNPDRGGWKAGDYFVFDGSVTYPWELFGYKLTSSLGIQNLADKTYYEGNVVAAEPRTWTLRTTLTF